MSKKKDEKNPPDPGENFEAMLDRLRGIVRNLEAGDVPLEESLKKFEEGILLAKHCQDRLTQAERKIEILVSADKDKITTEPFEAE